MWLLTRGIFTPPIHPSGSTRLSDAHSLMTATTTGFSVSLVVNVHIRCLISVEGAKPPRKMGG